MINWNGALQPEDKAMVSSSDRAFRYGDAAFETMLSRKGQVQFWEEHYFRLMAAMRILRMSIPMTYTPEYLEQEIIRTVKSADLLGTDARIRLQVGRGPGGTYMPQSDEVYFVIEAGTLDTVPFQVGEGLHVDVFRDHKKARNVLSSVKSSNALFYIIAAQWARENDLDDCLILNEDNQVIESTRSNLFLYLNDGKRLVTPEKDSGALKGIMQKKVAELSEKLGLELQERPISPFDVLKADEVWLTNSLRGVQSVRQYKKQSFGSEMAQKMNGLIELQFN
ncbi:MAG: D-alanine aminotransferase [Flavobacteriia bacterium]|nr:MAG: D-alanine aminotransferase [Flavobacteriia bacterium]